MDWSKLTSEAAAAWVQAIGSILALGIAILIPYRQRKQERADRVEKRRERTQNFLVGYAAPIIALAQNVRANEAEFQWLKDGPPNRFDGIGVLNKIKLTIDPSLKDAMRLMLDMDGPLIDPIRNLIIAADAYNTQVQRAIDAWPFGPEDWRAHMQLLGHYRSTLRELGQRQLERYKLGPNAQTAPQK